MKSALLVVALAASVSAAPPPIEVSTQVRFQFAPATVRVRVRIEPHPDNRRAAVGLVCGDSVVTSSEWDVHETDAPSTFKEFKDVDEPCDYVIVARLLRQTGQVFQSTTSMQIKGRFGES